MKWIPIALMALAACMGCHRMNVTRLSYPGPAQLPSGWSLAQNDKDGVAIGVAPGWHYGTDTGLQLQQMQQQFGLTGGDAPPPPPTANHATADTPGRGSATDNDEQQIGQAFANMEQQNREETEAKEKQEMANLESQGVILHVVSANTHWVPGEEETLYYVKLTHATFGTTLADATEAAKRGSRGDLTVTSMDLPIGPCSKMAEHYKTMGGDDIYETRYVMVNDTDIYTLAFTETGSDSEINSIDDAAAKSFRVQKR